MPPESRRALESPGSYHPAIAFTREQCDDPEHHERKCHAAPGATAQTGESWHPLADLPALPMPGPYRKALNQLLSDREP